MNSNSTFLDATHTFFFALIIAVSVLSVDLLVLLLLDFLKNVDSLLALLFWEGFAMMLVGAAGWGMREHEFFVVGWKRAEIHHVSYSPRYPGFWLSVAIAGLMLIFIDLYLVSQHY